jgi:transposase
MPRRDARSLDHKTLEEIRIRAVEQVQAGESPEDVIRTLGFTRSCIYTWLALYRAGGWGALRARALKGRPMKIQPQQMSWLYRTITGKSPLQYRFEFALWTREIVRMLLAEEFQYRSIPGFGGKRNGKGRRFTSAMKRGCARTAIREGRGAPKDERRWF